jgi:hypothetical protein
LIDLTDLRNLQPVSAILTDQAESMSLRRAFASLIVQAENFRMKLEFEILSMD